jgi:hypothetical protein
VLRRVVDEITATPDLRRSLGCLLGFLRVDEAYLYGYKANLRQNKRLNGFLSGKGFCRSPAIVSLDPL